MKDFARSVRTNNADLGLRPVIPDMVKDVAKIYEANGRDREKTKQELIKKHFMDERQAEEVLRQIVGNSKVGNAQKLYSDVNVEIYDDGMVKLSHFPGYTQWAKDVDSIVKDEIRGLENQITNLKNAANKVKEIGKKYGLL